jgi:hypothetical protein
VEATRLATQLLQDHAKEGRFEVRIDEAHDLELVAQRLKEAGCVVSINLLKRTLDIAPPEKPLSHPNP